MSLPELVQRAGVVGAGGGGFPTHVKIAAHADTIIANGAECEPLLHKDAAVMERHAADLVAGMQLVMQATGAARGVIGIKAKNAAAVAACEAACKKTPVVVHTLGDYYPAGDEYDLVYEVTGRLIPPQGLPLHVGCIVQNVETLVNVALAARGIPVTLKTLTIAGAVQHPVTVTLPIGTVWRDALDAAGGITCEDPVLLVGGAMMGETVTNLETPITKTTAGAIVLPRTHRLAERKLTPAPAQNRIGKSACDQCRFCTEMCPRYLLGYPVEPHQVMRSLAFTATDTSYWNQWASLCCACGLCTLYACPEQLYPKEACDQSKDAMREAGEKWSGPATVTPHAMRDGRKVPVKQLMKTLAIADYDNPAHWQPTHVDPRELRLRLKQHAGSPVVPCVKAGETVSAGQVLGEPPAGALGATLHAPCDATVADIDSTTLTLTRRA